jgi:hypothetical protein
MAGNVDERGVVWQKNRLSSIKKRLMNECGKAMARGMVGNMTPG